MSMIGNIFGKILGTAATAANKAVKHAFNKLSPEEALEKWNEFRSQLTEKGLDPNSMTDILKHLGMSSDLNSRKQIAKELDFNESELEDSATMNTHLMKKFQELFVANGGQPPTTFGHKA